MRILFLATLLFITACNPERIVIEKNIVKVIKPSSNLYFCPTVKKKDIPDPTTLTNEEIISFISLLIENQKICKINIVKIQKFIERAEEELRVRFNDER